MVERVGLVSKPEDERVRGFAVKVHGLLEGRGLRVVPDAVLAEATGLEGGAPLSRMEVDVVVTVGGDGTVLKTVMSLPDSGTPVLAVNMGRRGYLTEVDPGEVEDAIGKLVSGEYWVERLGRLSVFLNGGFLVDGLNEALITSSPPSKMLRFEVGWGDGGLLRLRADGLIVSTPTGSTAHAFSAGGPVVHPSVGAFNLVFICPLDPVRAVVVPDGGEVSVRVVAKRSSAVVRVDGSFEREVGGGGRVVVRKSGRDAFFVRFGRGHLERSLSRLIRGGG